VNERIIIGIDGLDGSGKSSFARRLLAALDLPAVIISVDDFRQPVRWSAHADRSEAEVYYEDYYDFGALEVQLAAFVAGARALCVPVYDSVQERRTGERALPTPDAVVAILEGVFVRRAPTARAASLIYLETSAEEARRRIAARDVKKNRSPAEIQRRIDQRYFPAQQRYHRQYRPRHLAALVIENNDFARPRVLRDARSGWPPPIVAAVDRLLPARLPHPP